MFVTSYVLFPFIFISSWNFCDTWGFPCTEPQFITLPISKIRGRRPGTSDVVAAEGCVCGVRLFCTSQFITYSHLSLTAVSYESVVKYTMKEYTRLIQKEITFIYIFLNAVLALLVQLQSVISNSREGDFQIAGLYGSTSVIPRLYDRVCK